MSPSAPFPLFDLPPKNLQQVLRKVESKSFRRLQCTSWKMWGAVQMNSKVTVFTEGDFYLRTCEDSMDLFKVVYQKNGISGQRKANPKGLYASRLASLDLAGFNSRVFEPICDFLQKYRITCDHLSLCYMEWQKDEYETLLELLKPVSVGQVQCLFNAFEGLYSSPILKNVTVEVDFDSAHQAASIFLAKCQQLKITVPDKFSNKRESEEQLWLFHRILQTLLSKPRSHLERFTFTLDTVMPKLPTEDTLRIEFADFELKDVFGDNGHLYGGVVLPEKHYSPKCFLEFDFRSGKQSAGDITYANYSLISPQTPQVGTL